MASGDRLEVLRDAAPVVAQALDVGPWRLSISACAPWDEALARLVSGYLQPPGAAAGRVRVIFEIALTTSSRAHHGLPRQARFTQADACLVDVSEGWDARFESDPDGARAIRATFALRDEPPIGPSPRWAIQRELVASAMRAALSLAAPTAHGLLLHAAALADPEGRGVVFLGPSGEGKTTLTRRLPWEVLSDDAALVWRDASAGWQVAGTPLRGKEGLVRSARIAPLTHVVVLQKGRPLELLPATSATAMAQLLSRTIHYAAPDARVLAVMQALAEGVPASILGSRLEDDLGVLGPRLAGAR